MSDLLLPIFSYDDTDVVPESDASAQAGQGSRLKDITASSVELVSADQKGESHALVTEKTAKGSPASGGAEASLNAAGGQSLALQPSSIPNNPEPAVEPTIATDRSPSSSASARATASTPSQPTVSSPHSPAKHSSQKGRLSAASASTDRSAKPKPSSHAANGAAINTAGDTKADADANLDDDDDDDGDELDFEARRRRAVFTAMLLLLERGARDEGQLGRLVAPMSGEELLQVAEERALAGHCGNPLCTSPHSVPQPTSAQQPPQQQGG
ncbi:hypothetical protein Agub_g5173, partial [Astrephomene gubernaculifera]